MTVPSHAVVTVSYNPDIAVLGRQLAAIAGATIHVVVDNASTDAAALRALVESAGALWLPQSHNLGLAAALNTGVAAALARAPRCEYLLFLDQDTEPAAGDAAALIAAAACLRGADARAGMAGALMIDAATGLSHGVHRIRGWRWSRAFPASDTAALPCASLNGSGLAVPADTFGQLGGFDEALFIDHVDSEYSFRAAAAGYCLHTVPAVRFAHRMGEGSLRFWLGRWRVWPQRSPQRHRYLFRNAILLMRRPYVPRAWKFWAPIKLLVTVLVHLAVDRDRGAQLRAMGRGVMDGWRGRSGPLPPN